MQLSLSEERLWPATSRLDLTWENEPDSFAGEGNLFLHVHGGRICKQQAFLILTHRF
jgi:hypothetical protein